MRQVEAGAGVGEGLLALSRAPQQSVGGVERRHGQPVILQQRLKRAYLRRGRRLRVEMRTITWVHRDIDEMKTLRGNLVQRDVERIAAESERRTSQRNGRFRHQLVAPLGTKSTFPVSPRSKRA